MRWLGTLAIGMLLAASACQRGEESSRKAHVFFKSGDLDAAAEHYRAAIEADPNNASAWEGLGNVAFERHAYDDAIAHYQKSISIDEKGLTARHKLAVSLISANRTSDAIRALEDAIGIEPKDAFALNALGGLHQKLGDLDKAKQYQLAALAADTEFHAARFALGSLLVDMGELDEAEREFSRLARHDQDSLAEYGFARLAAKREKWDETAKHLERVLAGGVAHPEKIAKDAVFAEGWSEPAMEAAKIKLDRAAGTKTSTAPLR